jgi:ABC-type branched-subunit amino acid transport system substrate-binding protein
MRKSVALLVALATCVIGAGCSRSGGSGTSQATSSTAAPGAAAPTATTAASAGQCGSTPLQATDIGITPTTITVEVMADVGSPLAPGLFQGSFDAVNAFAKYVNAHGGIACRQLVVKTWDTKIDPTESKNGLIDACANALALVGNTVLFDPDVSPMTGCVDKSGVPTGLPDIAALTSDTAELCASTAYLIAGTFVQHCPLGSGAQPLTANIGEIRWFLKTFGPLHGLYLAASDTPTLVQTAAYLIAAQRMAGVTFDATPKVSGSDTQPAYTPRVQVAKQAASNYVYNGSNDIAMIRMRKEAQAQGLTSVKVWGCTLACYTGTMLSEGGTAVEGTYLYSNFLPFEEASDNAQDEAYVSSVSSPSTWGAEAWQAGLAFKQVVDKIVATSGPNAITRAAILDGLKNIGLFTADGWMGTTNLRDETPCFMVMQIQGGKFVRVYPTKPGTLDCDPGNDVTVTLDMVAAGAQLK